MNTKILTIAVIISSILNIVFFIGFISKSNKLSDKTTAYDAVVKELDEKKATITETETLLKESRHVLDLKTTELEEAMSEVSASERKFTSLNNRFNSIRSNNSTLESNNKTLKSNYNKLLSNYNILKGRVKKREDVLKVEIQKKFQEEYTKNFYKELKKIRDPLIKQTVKQRKHISKLEAIIKELQN